MQEKIVSRHDFGSDGFIWVPLPVLPAYARRMKPFLWSRRAFGAFGLAAVAGTAAETQPAWRARVANDREPGERLIIRGKARRPGGASAAGVKILVYQTDAAGIYSKAEGPPKDTARLKGEFTVGPAGEYEIVTIKPGHYPGQGVPAHIHVNVVDGPGGAMHEIFEFFFAGDKYLKGGEKGIVLKLEKDASGVWRASQDFEIPN